LSYKNEATLEHRAKDEQLVCELQKFLDNALAQEHLSVEKN
jgi:hypothetical protein